MRDITFAVEALDLGRWVITATKEFVTITLIGVYETEVRALNAIEDVARRWLENHAEVDSLFAA